MSLVVLLLVVNRVYGDENEARGGGGGHQTHFL